MKRTRLDQHEACGEHASFGPVFNPADKVGERRMDLLHHRDTSTRFVMRDEYVHIIALQGTKRPVGRNGAGVRFPALCRKIREKDDIFHKVAMHRVQMRDRIGEFTE